MTEKQLIEKCRQGDSRAFRRLYDLYADKMLGICIRYVRDRDTARDLLHDGFLTVYSKIGDFRGEGSFEGWLRRIFVTTALGYLRRNKNSLRDLSMDDCPEVPGDYVSAVEKLSADELLETIDRLPDGYRTVLSLYAVDGYSHKEVAELLGITENTSRSQYSRAKHHLKRLLERNAEKEFGKIRRTGGELENKR